MSKRMYPSVDDAGGRSARARGARARVARAALDALEGRQLLAVTGSAPVAFDDVVSVGEDQPRVIAPLELTQNDVDADGDKLAIFAFTQPLHGRIVADAKGNLSYAPPANFVGTGDSFQYRVWDGQRPSNWATVTIAIEDVNDGPLPGDDFVTLADAGPLVIPATLVLANDTDPDLLPGNPLSEVLSMHLTFADSVPGQTPEEAPKHGTVVLDNKGTADPLDDVFIYTPTGGAPQADQFVYYVRDRFGTPNGALISINVAAPTVADDAYVVAEDAAGGLAVGAAAGVLANDAPAAGASGVFAALVTPPRHGQLTLNADGSFTYVPDLHFAGTDTFVYEARGDDQFFRPAAGRFATVTITVTPVADAPVTPDLTVTRLAGQEARVAPHLLAYDPEGGALTYSVAVPPATGSVMVDDGGTPDDPTDDLFVYAPAPGTDPLTVTFGYRATDPTGLSSVGTVTLQRGVPNQAPTIGSLDAVPNPATQPQVVTIVASGVADADGTVSLVRFYRETNGQAGLQFGSGGDLLLGEDATADDPGTYSISFSTAGFPLGVNTYTHYAIAVDDQLDAGPTATVVHVINDPEVERAPVVTDLAALPTHPATGATVSLSASASDPNSTGSVASVSFYQESNGLPGLQRSAVTATDRLVVMPLGDSITNGGHDASLVPGGYRAPLYAALTSLGFAGGVDFVGDSQANAAAGSDPDHAGHPGFRTYEVRSVALAYLNDPATIKPNVILLHAGTNDMVDSANWEFARDQLYFMIRDITAAAPDATLIVSDLIPMLDPVAEERARTLYNPFIADIVQEFANLGRKVSFVSMHPVLSSAPLGFNPDFVDAYHPSAEGYQKMASAWLEAIAAAGVSPVARPADTALGTDAAAPYGASATFPGGTVTYYAQALDDTGRRSLVAELTVEGQGGGGGANEAPVSKDDAYAVDEGGTLKVAAPGVLGNDSDADGDALTAELVSGPAHGTLKLNPDGSFTYKPDAGFRGTDSFRYRADDGKADGNTVTVTITVRPAAEPPGSGGGTAVLVTNPFDRSKKDLVVTGTERPDTIRVEGRSDGSLRVFINGVDKGTFRPTGGIVVDGLAGDDVIRVEGTTRGALLLGGRGNDRISGGGGNDLILGGDGQDELDGGEGGYDALVGGAGRDKLDASRSKGALLIGGAVTFGKGVTLDDLARELAGGVRSATGLSALQSAFCGWRLPTIVDDDADTITASNGTDWIVASRKDVLLGKVKGDLVLYVW